MRYLVAVKEIRVRGVDVARLHAEEARVRITEMLPTMNRNLRDEIRHKLGSWVHGSLEEVDDNGVEPFPQRRESPERLL